MLRPATHTDPNAIPRNGTDVPWVELPGPRTDEEPERQHPGDDQAAGSGETTAARGTAPQSLGT